ncbi:MAG: hypothetical protein PHD21_07315 [Flavobacteriales bacterium]|nr:hypothetical protein [Flavobacteriales bacterium]
MKKTFTLKYLLFAITAILSIYNATGQNVDTLFTSANQAYKDAQYQKAADQYQQILTAGYQSAELYNNLGNSYYRLGQIAPTILAYERAALLAPSDKDIQHNLTLARRLATDTIVPLGTSLTQRVMEAVSSVFSASTWGILAIVAAWATLFLFGFFLYSHNVGVKRMSFYLFIITLLCAGAFLAMNRYNNAKVNDCPYAIVTASNITIKSEPSDAGGDAFILHEGAKLAIEESLDKWYKIRIADGKTGWIPTWAIEKI